MPALSQGHPCPQLFAKRHQTSIGKDVCKYRLAEKIGKKEKERKGRRKRKSSKERESKKHTIFCEEEIDWFTNGI
jgi:hypothetical protein